MNDELRRAGQKLDRNKSDVYGTGEFPTPPDDVILEETRLLQSKVSQLSTEVDKMWLVRLVRARKPCVTWKNSNF